MDLLALAMKYASWGWSVFPVAGKRPLASWKRWQTERATPDELRAMFADPRVTGIAIALGSVSGGLAVRDFDTNESYYAWCEANLEASHRLPTVRTARGWHVYCRLEAEAFVDFGDGELRGTSGHYVLAAGSLHPDGGRYRWVGEPTGVLPLVDVGIFGGVIARAQVTRRPARRASRASDLFNVESYRTTRTLGNARFAATLSEL